MPERNKIVISGTLGSTDAARWSIGLSYGAVVDGDGVEEGATNLTEWAQAIATFIGSGAIVGPRMLSCLTAEGTITDVTAYYYRTGEQQARNVGQASLVKSGTGTVRMPAQSSVVCSLRTAVSGRSFRGRFYWPAIGETMTDTLKFTAGAAPALAPEFAALVSGVATASPVVALLPKVYSPTRDLLTTVSAVSVGDVPDTQRRRRDNLVENYITQSLLE